MKTKFSAWSATNQAAFQLDCPIFYEKHIQNEKQDYLCCTEDQYELMQQQYSMIVGLCEVSTQILRNVWCNYACHPSQTLFVDVTEVHYYPSSTRPEESFPAIEEVSYYVGDDWARDVYDYTKADVVPKILCNPEAGCDSGLGLLNKMGIYQFDGIGSPNQVNFIAASTLPLENKCDCSLLSPSSSDTRSTSNNVSCIFPLDEVLPTCVGVCGFVCDASPTPLPYTPGCVSAESVADAGAVNNN
jgi:Niemann-Pick C1 protein